MLNINFSTDIQRIKFWCYRMGVDLHSPEHLTEPYTWCQNHLQNLADLLVEYNGFRQVHPTDHRMLFAVAPYSNGPQCFDQDGACMELPIDASSFFSPHRQAQWQEIFHSKVWEDYDRPVAPGINNVFMDLLYTLQCLLPGMLILVEGHDGHSKQRGIPPCNWIRENKDILVPSIGIARYNTLWKAAADPQKSMIDPRKLRRSA